MNTHLSRVLSSVGYIAFLAMIALPLINVPHVSASEAIAAPMVTAHQVVEGKTGELIELIRSAQNYVDEDEARFYDELETLLEPFIDFRSFARAVMGRHASRSAMNALPAEQQDVLEGQIDRFSDVFAKGLVQTYGKGLLAFEGERIEVVPAEQEDPTSSRAAVKQLIYGERPKPFEVVYSLRRDGHGQWKLRNVIIENINLGKVYRNQFAQQVKVYGGDIDRVISQWSVVPSS